MHSSVFNTSLSGQSNSPKCLLFINFKMEDVPEVVVVKAPTNSSHSVDTLEETSSNSLATSDSTAVTTSDSRIVQKLNGVVLQYLESCGLEESYTMLYRECKIRGIDLPPEVSQPGFPTTKFRPSDGVQLLNLFDDEEGTELLETWQNFLDDRDPSDMEVCKNITFFLHVYAAIIPYLQNKSDEEKSQGMRKLRGFFDKKTMEDATDDNMLTLFALPYVSDPMKHPILQDLFQVPWRDKLRSQIEDVLKRHFQRNRKFDSSSCDLTHMFLKWKNNNLGSGSEDNLSPSTSKTFMDKSNQTDEIQQVNPENPANNSDSNHINKDMLEMQAQLKRQQYEFMCLRKSKQKFEQQYHKLLKVTGQMAGSLDKALQGKSQDIGELFEKLQELYPELFSSVNNLEIEGEIGDGEDVSEL